MTQAGAVASMQKAVSWFHMEDRTSEMVICDPSTQVVGKAEAAEEPEAQPTTCFLLVVQVQGWAQVKGGSGVFSICFVSGFGKLSGGRGVCRYHWCRGPRRKCEGQAIARSLCRLVGPPWGRLRGEVGSASPWAALWRLFGAWWFYCASCSGSLTSSTTTFQGVSRPRVMAQGVTASLIGIEL